jgi:hypothetical protein
MTTTGSHEIHSAPRGAHWTAWVSRPGSQLPYRSIVLVGKTQEDAVARAEAWVTSTYNPEFLGPDS